MDRAAMWSEADRRRAPVGDFPPRWAARWGDDVFGLFAELRVGPVVQRMRWIEPGSFLMGSPEAEAGHEDREGPQHRVTLSCGFWLADTACTQGLWMAVMDGANPSYFADAPDAAERPVEQVKWDDVQGFLERLTTRLPAVCEAFLPTEAQWEYAARAGSGTAYFWSDEVDSGRANWNGEQHGTTAVKRYPANPWGLYDIHGNVWEWCSGSLRPYRRDAVTDPPDGGDASYRALRGGSWDFDAGRARSAYRNHDRRGSVWYVNGFRFALRSTSPGSGGA
jgi:formylglycine-generating enzyme required for sulfatase activity